jgi:hypothetical protein
MQSKACFNATSFNFSIVRRLGTSLSIISIIAVMFALCSMQIKGVSGMLSIKRFSAVHGRAGVRSFLQYNDYSPSRANAMMMSSVAGADATPKKEKSKGKKKEGESKYSKTVLLPVTAFDQRANSLKRLVLPCCSSKLLSTLKSVSVSSVVSNLS